MRPATSRRLQAYLTGLATTTGLVASSGATIITIDLTDIGGVNAGLTDGATATVSNVVNDFTNFNFFNNYEIEMGDGLGGVGTSAFVTGISVRNTSEGPLGLADYQGYAGIAISAPFGGPYSAIPRNFAKGAEIGTDNRGYTSYGSCSGFKYGPYNNSTFTAPVFGKDSYLGFTDGQGGYGWLEVTWNGTDQFEVKSGAFNDSGAIVAGGGELTAVPEPGNLLALSGLVGSAMFLRNRRRKSVA
jgi:hypothetical protein